MRYIEKSWESYRKMVLPKAKEEELIEHRKAFLAGAAILFTSVLKGLSEGDGVTEGDMRFMADIQTEVDEFGHKLDLEVLGMQLTSRRSGSA